MKKWLILALLLILPVTGHAAIYAVNAKGVVTTIPTWAEATGASYAGSTIHVTSSYTLTPGTFPSDRNVVLDKGANLIMTTYTFPNLEMKPGSAITNSSFLTLSGTFTADISSHFVGSGSVIFAKGSIPTAYPQWFGAKGDYPITDDTAAIVKTIASFNHITWPAGEYKVTSSLHPSFNSTWVGTAAWGLQGVEKASLIHGSDNLSILLADSAEPTFALENFTMRGMSFRGKNAKALYQGTLSNYIVRLKLYDCTFGADMAEAIYGNLIFAHIENNTFGDSQYIDNTISTRRYIYSSGPTPPNYTNDNFIIGNHFNNSKVNPAIDWSYGTGLVIRNNDFEVNINSYTIALNTVINVELSSNWFEGTVGVSELHLTTCDGPVTIANNRFASSNLSTSVVKIDGVSTKITSVGNSGGGTTFQYVSDGVNGLSNNQLYTLTSINDAILLPSPQGSMKNVMQQDTSSFSPDFTNLTVALSGGTVTYTGKYTKIGNVVNYVINIIVTGAATTAATTSTFVTGFPYLPTGSGVCVSVSSNGVGNTNGYVYTGNGRLYVGVWSAVNANQTISGFYYTN